MDPQTVPVELTEEQLQEVHTVVITAKANGHVIACCEMKMSRKDDLELGKILNLTVWPPSITLSVFEKD